MLSLVSPVITAFHSCCLYFFDQVNLWPEEETIQKKKNYQDEDKKSAIDKN